LHHFPGFSCCIPFDFAHGRPPTFPIPPRQLPTNRQPLTTDNRQLTTDNRQPTTDNRQAIHIPNNVRRQEIFPGNFKPPMHADQRRLRTHKLDFDLRSSAVRSIALPQVAKPASGGRRRLPTFSPDKSGSALRSDISFGDLPLPPLAGFARRCGPFALTPIRSAKNSPRGEGEEWDTETRAIKSTSYCAEAPKRTPGCGFLHKQPKMAPIKHKVNKNCRHGS
jgi:hypothetical protein